MAKISGQLPLNRAEKDVIVALKQQLPDDWLLVPSVRWAKRDSMGFVRDGEADIVILAPRLGMLVVEVKGSREIRVTDAGWQRFESGGWLLLDQTPVAQATSNAHELKRIICDALRWGNEFPGLFGWLAIYPNGNANQLPTLFDHTTLATRRHMTGLQTKVRDALMARGSSSIAQGFSIAAMEAVGKVLTSSEFRIVPADGAQEVSEDKGAIERLTRQQFSALRGLFDFPSVAVAGPAGSGKTVLALWRLEQLLSAGQRAFYACYNRRLAEFLRLKSPGLAAHIHNADQLFGRICPNIAGTMDREEFHRRELPNYVFDEVSGWSDERKFDAVIVDEAQDLSESQVLALNAFVKTGGSWAVFLDQRQDIYQPDTEEALITDVLFKLSHNCRNTVAINRKANDYVGSDINSMPGMPEGLPVQIERVARGQMANRAFQLAKEWKAGGENSVAILSPFVLHRSAMAGHTVGHSIFLTTELNELQSPSKAYFSTIKSFKGIEADCVVIVNASRPDNGAAAFTMEDLYVACTRAKARLAILAEDDEAVRFFRVEEGLSARAR